MSPGPLAHGAGPPCAPTQTGTPPPSAWLLPTPALLFTSGQGAALCLSTHLSFVCRREVKYTPNLVASRQEPAEATAQS